MICGCSSMVEHQPSKLDTWVRFPSPAFCVRSTQVCAADTGEAGKAGDRTPMLFCFGAEALTAFNRLRRGGCMIAAVSEYKKLDISVGTAILKLKETTAHKGGLTD